MFNNLLNETKGFKYQITVKVLLKKYKLSGEIELAPVYFNTTTRTIIHHKFRLENSFQEILYIIDAWINKNQAGVLNQLSLSILTFQLVDHYQEVLT